MKKRLVAMSLATASLTMPQFGWAQSNSQADESETSRTLDVIVVESQRRSQSILDVPISVTAFGAAEIESYNITAIEDYASITPNLGFSTDGSPLGANVNIRGVENIGGIVNSIGIYVDEINTTPSLEIFAYDSNLFDIERIEVLRGPQGTLFGRNVLGGVINISTVKPHDRLSANFDAQYGSFDQRRLKGSLNVPVADGFYARGTVLYDATNGWINDGGSFPNTNDRKTTGGRLALRLEPSPQTTIDLSASYSDYEMGLPDAIPSGLTNPFFTAFGIPADPLGDYDGIGFYPENDDTVLTNRPFERNREVLLTSARLEQDFDGMVGILNAGYIDATYDQTQDNDYVDSEWFYELNDGSVESYSLEGRLQSDGDGPRSWVIGASYAEDTSTFLEQGFALPNLVLRVVGVQLPPGAELRVDGDNIERGVESLGVFGDASFTLGDAERWVLSIGARYSQTEVSDQLISEPNINNGFSQFQLGPVSETFETLTARGSLLYKVTDDINVYGTVSRGTKPGGFNLFALESGDVPSTYDIETLMNYEIGTKGALAGNRFTYSVAAFYMDWSDLQFFTTFVTDDTVGTAETITLNAGKASSYGIEADFAALLTDNLELRGGIGYLVAELGDGDDVAPGIDVLGQPFDIDGNHLPRSPRLSFNLAAEYSAPVRENIDGFFRVEGSYRTSQFEDISNGDNSLGMPTPNEVPSYGLVNLRAGLRSDGFTLTLFGENLLEETEVIGIRPSVSIAGSPFSIARRQFGIRATFSY